MGKACRYAGVDCKTIYRMLERGDLNGEKIPGGHGRIGRESIDDYFDGRKKSVDIVRSLGL